ncbi:hypothetical protein WA026_018319 [Henosepilachna vigintioctopunctata]|uniref:Uncharacterized protein n=1 Tax=Henosepilachna vigintioctopunctata TaxID=420089 RepID=A0AAW1VFP2_9CUCU
MDNAVDAFKSLSSRNEDRFKHPETELIELFTCDDLTRLENVFKSGKYDEGMNKDEFFSAIKSCKKDDVPVSDKVQSSDDISTTDLFLLGTSVFMYKARRYFVDVFTDGTHSRNLIILGLQQHTGIPIVDDAKHYDQLLLAFFDKYQLSHRLTWGSVLGALLNAFPSERESRINLNFLGIDKNELTRRDSIVKVLTIETTAHFCFTVYSKYGKTGIYDANFKELTSYHVIMTREDISRKDEEKRRRNRWITDAIYLQDLKKILVINTARSLTIYDVVGLNHIPLFLILSLHNVPKCIAYKFEGTSSDRHIFIGDDSGSILVFSFIHSKEIFLRKKHNDKLSLYYLEELQTEKEYVKINTIKSIHKEIIREIIYCKEDNTLTTCSRDPNASVVKLFLDHKKPTMIYEMYKGASTMCYSKNLNLLITGSPDGTIRLWNTLVISEAIAVLKEHKSGIKDILLLENQKLFISCAKDGIMKLWSVDSQKCCQSIHLDFPSLKETGKIVEWATNCVFLGPKVQEQKEKCPNSTSSTLYESSVTVCERNKSAEGKFERSLIWVSCCNYLASISLEFLDNQIKKEFEMPQLSPPPKQNNVFIPSTWLLNDEILDELINKVQSDIEHPEKFKDYKYISRKGKLDKEERGKNINQKIAQIDKEKRNMHDNIAKGAPFLALKLFDIEELGLSDNLAIHGKEEKHIMDKTRNLLTEAKNKDQVFSELSSSRSRSSRSSIVEFEY